MQVSALLCPHSALLINISRRHYTPVFLLFHQSLCCFRPFGTSTAVSYFREPFSENCTERKLKESVGKIESVLEIKVSAY